MDALIWQLAWRSWKALPPALKVWLEPDDLHSEAVAAVWRGIDRWDPSRGAFTTFAWRVAQSALTAHYSFQTAAKRYHGVNRCIDDVPPIAYGGRGDLPVVDAVIAAWFGGDSDGDS